MLPNSPATTYETTATNQELAPRHAVLNKKKLDHSTEEQSQIVVDRRGANEHANGLLRAFSQR